MVLGVSRPQSSYGESLPAPIGWWSRRPATRDWIAHRGAVLFEATGDVVGGFPGYADRGGRLEAVRCQVTERYLVVGERQPYGFGLPIPSLAGAVLVGAPRRTHPDLRVIYRDGLTVRLFTVRFREPRIARWSGRRAERAREALLAAGLAEWLPAALPAEPNFTVHWDQTRDLEAENVLWTGRATAPLRVGLPGVASEVWLTTRSLIWGSGAGDGINRVPLSMVIDVTAAHLADRRRTPALFVGIGEERGGRHELAFIFDQQDSPDRNVRERGAFFVGLRSRGIPLGAPTPPLQPWRGEGRPLLQERAPVAHACAVSALSREAAGLVTERSDQVIGQGWPRQTGAVEVNALVSPPSSPPSSDDGCVGAPRKSGSNDTCIEPEADTLPTDAPSLAQQHTPAPVGGADRVLAEWSAPPAPGHDLGQDVPLAMSWTLPEVVREEISDPMPKSPASTASGAPDRTAWTQVRAFESAALAALAEALNAIHDRAAGRVPVPLVELPPSAVEQAQALAALIDLARVGELSPEDLHARKARLLALGEAAVRLRTLLELRDAGHLSDADLAHKRTAITTRLGEILVPQP